MNLLLTYLIGIFGALFSYTETTGDRDPVVSKEQASSGTNNEESSIGNTSEPVEPSVALLTPVDPTDTASPNPEPAQELSNSDPVVASHQEDPDTDNSTPQQAPTSGVNIAPAVEPVAEIQANEESIISDTSEPVEPSVALLTPLDPTDTASPDPEPAQELSNSDPVVASHQEDPDTDNSTPQQAPTSGVNTAPAVEPVAEIQANEESSISNTSEPVEPSVALLTPLDPTDTASPDPEPVTASHQEEPDTNSSTPQQALTSGLNTAPAVEPVAEIQAADVIAPQQPDGVETNTSNIGSVNALLDTGSSIEVVTGRVTTLDPVGEDIASVRVIDGPEHGNLTVNPDNTLALVLTETDYVGALSISYEITHGDGTTEVVNTSLETVAGPVSGGWGTGDHYMLETDVNDDVIVEWGNNHRDVYMSGSDSALTLSDIAARENLDVSQITRSWLLNHPEYGGSENMALAEDAGNRLWVSLVKESYSDKPASHWLRLEAGYEYELHSQSLTGIRGESELQPFHITSYGDGEKPVITSELETIAEGAHHLVVSNVELADGVRLISGKNIILDGLTSTDDLIIQNLEDITIRNSSITDVAHEESQSEGYWEEFANRLSGIYASNTDGLLLESNFWDHNGWADGYHEDLSLDGNMAPSILSHNIYIQSNSFDVTLQENISMRGASFGAQIRSGGYFEDNALIDNNGSYFVGGGPVTTDGVKTYHGNYSLISGNVTTSGQHLLADGLKGQTAGGIGNYAPLTTLVDNIVTHLADPDNPDELAEKYKANFAINNTQTTYYDDTIVYNWAGANEDPNLRDQNIEDLDTGVLDDTTIQNYAAQILSKDDATIEDLADYLKTLAQNGQIDAEKIISFFQSGFGIELDDRFIAETLRFVPNDLGAGIRWGNRLNWSTEDLPGTVQGDSVDLAGNWVHYSGTTTLQDLDLGDGGKLSIEQGRLNVEGNVLTDGTDSVINIDEAGQLWVNGYSNTDDDLTINIDGGRFANIGKIDGQFEMHVSDGQAILATSGSIFDILDGSELSITGDAAEVGFDGADGNTAVLRMQEGGTLRFSAENNAFGTIGEFRSGANGEAETDINSGFNMGDGTLELDFGASSFDLGSTHTLIKVDELVGAFSTIKVDGLAPNLDAKLFVNYESDAVQVQILGSGDGSFDFEVIGNQDSAQSNTDLWSALTVGQPVLSEDLTPNQLIIDDALIDL